MKRIAASTAKVLAGLAVVVLLLNDPCASSVNDEHSLNDIMKSIDELFANYGSLSYYLAAIKTSMLVLDVNVLYIEPRKEFPRRLQYLDADYVYYVAVNEVIGQHGSPCIGNDGLKIGDIARFRANDLSLAFYTSGPGRKKECVSHDEPSRPWFDIKVGGRYLFTGQGDGASRAKPCKEALLMMGRVFPIVDDSVQIRYLIDEHLDPEFNIKVARVPVDSLGGMIDLYLNEK